MLTPLVLGALALVLASPVPWALARWPGLRHTPVPAMLLWQSTALAAVLAALGAGLSLVTSRLWDGEVGRLDVVLAALAGGVTVVVTGRLLLSGHRTGTTLRRLRRRHREQVDLLARVDHEAAGGTAGRGLSVLDHEVPVAYCVPGMTGSRIVVSRSTLTRLAPAELEAVVAHERSHLRARHDLVLEAFTVLHRAFPRWVSSAAAHHEVQVLVEVLADRAAVRRGDRRALASALLALAGSRTPGGALGATGTGLAERVAVLRDTRPRRVQSVLVSLAALGLIALPSGLVVLPWLAGLR
ncbi:M56 family metallopeptidase [Nocardioides sediminis]|uniref:M56 family metallopeptidase n=1 Tax=Nocardioides sediminis TaxID=433648 RepID=UPI000D304ADC|nr:M56 family metallopeptidase [Nocardioides sediminis]